MIKRVLQVVCALLIVLSAGAQKKVANYSSGEAGTDKYEHFSFWTNSRRRAGVTYTYGTDRKETTLSYIGRKMHNGQAAFAVQFPNKYVLYIVSKGTQLLVSDSAGKYNKIFSWEYEGPVNGIGTFCDVCAQDEAEAMKLLHSAYVAE